MRVEHSSIKRKMTCLTLDSPEGTSWPFAISNSFMSLTEQNLFNLSFIPQMSWLWFCISAKDNILFLMLSPKKSSWIKLLKKSPLAAPPASSSLPPPPSSVSLRHRPLRQLCASWKSKPQVKIHFCCHYFPERKPRATVVNRFGTTKCNLGKRHSTPLISLDKSIGTPSVNENTPSQVDTRLHGPTAGIVNSILTRFGFS